MELHWSCCVVLHPYAIENLYPESYGYETTNKTAYMLHLDSLKGHDVNIVYDIIVDWMNDQWLCCGTSQNIDNPFNKSTFKVYEPIGKLGGVLICDSFCMWN